MMKFMKDICYAAFKHIPQSYMHQLRKSILYSPLLSLLQLMLHKYTHWGGA